MTDAPKPSLLSRLVDEVEYLVATRPRLALVLAAGLASVLAPALGLPTGIAEQAVALYAGPAECPPCPAVSDIVSDTPAAPGHTESPVEPAEPAPVSDTVSDTPAAP